MLQHFLTGAALVALLSCFWLAVQRLWASSFAEQKPVGGDALAGRGGCYGCSCDKAACDKDVRDTHITEANSDAPAGL